MAETAIHVADTGLPFCKLKRRHGGGVVGEDDPREALGFRTPHCMNRPPDVSEAYKVTDLNPARTIEVLRELGYELT